jgi:hypothetical protein
MIKNRTGVLTYHQFYDLSWEEKTDYAIKIGLWVPEAENDKPLRKYLNDDYYNRVRTPFSTDALQTLFSNWEYQMVYCQYSDGKNRIDFKNNGRVHYYNNASKIHEEFRVPPNIDHFIYQCQAVDIKLKWKNTVAKLYRKADENDCDPNQRLDSQADAQSEGK